MLISFALFISLHCINAIATTAILGENNITRGLRIGEGSFANIYKARFNGQTIALKLPKHRYWSSRAEISCKEYFFLSVFHMLLNPVIES
jgi:hypothetical protein